MVNIDKKLLNVLQESSCFGLAYDSTVSECKKCDMSAQCNAKSKEVAFEIAHSKPISQPDDDNRPVVTKKSTAKSTKSKSVTKAKAKDTKDEIKDKPKKKTSAPKAPKANTAEVKTIEGDMPDFKPMSLDELKEIANSNSVEWKDYGNENITRMRLIMAIKKLYQE